MTELARFDTLQSKEAYKEARRTILVTIFPGMPMLIVGTRQFPWTFAPGDVHAFNQQFVEILEDLRVDVQGKGIDLTAYDHNYLVRLRDAGKAAYNQVFPRAARDYIAELEAEEQKRGLSFTFRTPPIFPLLWEALYAGEPFGVKPDRFWGFRYPVGHTYWEIEAPDRIKLQDGIFSAIHGSLQYSKQEVEQLVEQVAEASQRTGIELKLQFLDQVIPAESLSAEQLIELFHDSEFRYGVVHFACHCENPEDAGAAQAYLSLTAHEKELEMYLEKLLAWQDYGFVHRPFVFLNACESATLGHLLQMLSLPTGILGFGAGGVVASTCTMPDNFASAFATEFYKRLLKLDAGESEDEGRPFVNLSSNIGEALLETRLHFLHKYNNPLGLAYGLYAVSNQQLRLKD